MRKEDRSLCRSALISTSVTERMAKSSSRPMCEEERGNGSEDAAISNPVEVESVGIEAIREAKSFSTFVHLFVYLTHMLEFRTTPTSFSRGLNDIGPSDDEDIVIVFRLEPYLSSVIAGDYTIHRAEDDTIFDLMNQFPLKALERVKISTLQGYQESAKVQVEKLVEKHNTDTETGEIFLVSFNVVMFCLGQTAFCIDPLKTFWKYWSPESSKQRLGEAIVFMLCLLDRMTTETLSQHGSTEAKVLQTTSGVHE